MKQTRWLILSLTLSVGAALAVPTAGLAHELEMTSVAFNGNHLMASARTLDPLQGVGVEAFQGSFKFEGQKGKPIEGMMVNAFAGQEDWWVNPDGTCTIWQETWAAQSSFWVENHDGAIVTFTSPYEGSMSIELVMHGVRSTYENKPYQPGDEWCGWNEEPADLTEHLGARVLEIDATWESVVTGTGKGRKNRNAPVVTTITFESVTFGGEALEIVFNADPHHLSPEARSGPFMEREITHLEHLDLH